MPKSPNAIANRNSQMKPLAYKFKITNQKNQCNPWLKLTLTHIPVRCAGGGLHG